MELNNELLAKAAKSPEELLALAKENNVELTEESAKAYFDQLHPQTGELSDDELDNVAGGGCYSSGGRLKTTCGHKCRHYVDGPSTFGVKGTCLGRRPPRRQGRPLDNDHRADHKGGEGDGAP